MIDNEFHNPNDYWRYHEDRQQDYDEDDGSIGCIFSMLYLALLAVGLLVLTLFASCTTTKYVEVERVSHDTTYVSKHSRDSIYLHDSVHVKEKGDTVWVERWHTQWRERTKTDTVYKSRVDSVPAPYPVDKRVEVEKQLTWWQTLQIWLGRIVLALAACGGALLVINAWIKK